VRWRHAIWLVIRAVFVVAVLGYIVSRLDLQVLLAQAQSIQPGYVLLGFAVWFVSLILATLRWYVLARSVTTAVSFSFLLRYSFVGIFYSQFLPSSISGDVVRGIYVARARTDKAAMFSSSLVERVIGMATNGAVGLLALCAAPEILHLFGLEMETALGLVILILLAASAGYVVLQRAKLPEHRLPRVILVPYQTLRAYTAKPIAMGLSLLISVVYFLLWTVALWALGLAVGINQINFTAMLVVLSAINVAQILPLSVNGWGVREGALVALLAIYGVQAETAVLLSLLWALVALLAAVVGGILLVTDRVSDGTRDKSDS